ncbi:hypothetical protein ACFVVP_26140 [Streptomyces sp. NPDC058128]|uniref:hypothetical protein n=1 Tax=Streptomyces sp. NPDC058128 TaxID=3346352 RepID=UPI0036ED6F93
MPDRVRGEPVPDEKLNPSFTDRLAFLLDTRRAPDGKPHKKVHIADSLALSRGMVSALFSGDRDAGIAVIAVLEEFFDVDPGFLSTSGRRALARALRPRYATLVTLSDLREKRVGHLAMRSSIHVADIRLAGQLQQAVAAAFAAPVPEPLAKPAPEPEADPDEQELREITRQVRALAPTSRSRLMGTIRGLLRQS